MTKEKKIKLIAKKLMGWHLAKAHQHNGFWYSGDSNSDCTYGVADFDPFEKQKQADAVWRRFTSDKLSNAHGPVRDSLGRLKGYQAWASGCDHGFGKSRAEAMCNCVLFATE